MKILYGPLFTRRLGISMGIDIVPYKTCSYNCVYCHEGETTSLSLARKSFFEPKKIVQELCLLTGIKQLRGLKIDYLTFAGSGEPTLNQNIGEYIRYLKDVSPIPVAVLTNSSLLWDEEVRNDLSTADLVVPSLDAASEAIFQRVNRPCPGFTIDKVIEGLRQFCNEFTGRIWLEILLCSELNDGKEELHRLADIAAKLDVDKIQINTVSRSPALHDVCPASFQTLTYFHGLLGDKGELVQEESGIIREKLERELEDAILKSLRFKPGNMQTLSQETEKSGQEVIKVLSRLEKEGMIQRYMLDKTTFYKVVQ